MSLKERMTGQQAVKASDTEKVMRRKVTDLEGEFQKAMPRGAEARQLVRDALTVISNNPRLAECTRVSVLGGLMTMAQLGLRPGVLGHGWLLPLRIRGELQAQLIIGYQGLVTLAQRSGLIESISSRVVYERDEFDIEYGTSDRLTHRPYLKGDRGAEIGAYAVVKANGGVYWDYMSRTDLERHRDEFAMAKKNGVILGPWRDHFWAMAQKTVLKRALKYAPRSTELMNAMAADDTVRVDLRDDQEISVVSQYVGPETVTGETVDVPAGADQYQAEDPPGMDPWAAEQSGVAQ